MKLWLVIFICTGLLGCNTTSEIKKHLKQEVDVITMFNHALFIPQPVLSEQAIFSLPEHEAQAIQHYVERYKNSNMTKDEILGNFLQAKVANFSYDGATLIAQEALSQQAGNCISLAILSQAYANILGVETRYAKVDSFPMYQKNRHFVLTSSHFKTKLITSTKAQKDGSILLMSGGTVIDYFPNQDSVFSGNARYEDLVAKFYANQAVSALLEVNYNMAYSLLSSALEYAPTDPEIINIAALLHKHAGDRASAKRIYDYAIQHRLTSTNLLLNYLSYIPADQVALRDTIQKQLEQSPASPFDTLSLASSYIEKQRYIKAKQLIEPLLLNYHYLPEVYVELGKIAYLEKRYEAASHYFDQAIKKSREVYKKDIYTAKRGMLNQFISNSTDTE
ncbi:hypothetical protein [Pseudoalteromonas piscicida]|uniref:tetratricopeptide repeat protein n=1 Tax=Pseudoalteromonas piscicida TaxID=43662 RepID=UPI003096EB47